MYPALYRLEEAGLLASKWTKASGRRRRVYSLTGRGRAELARGRSEWKSFAKRGGVGGRLIEAYLQDLSRELAEVGIRGRLRSRILAESEDHLRSDPDGVGRFGSPRDVANTFASELGARTSRRAAVGAFVALGVAGAVYAVAFVGASFAHQPAARHVAACRIARVRGRDPRAPGCVRQRDRSLSSARCVAASESCRATELTSHQPANGPCAPRRPGDDGRAGAPRVRAPERERRLVGRFHARRVGRGRDLARAGGNPDASRCALATESRRAGR